MIAMNLQREGFPAHFPKAPGPSGGASPFEALPEITLKKGQVIFREGSSSSQYIYLVTRGLVMISSFHDGKEVLEDYYQEGELFNIEILFGQNRRELTAEAMTQLSAIKKIPLSNFRWAIKTNPGLLEEVMSNLSCSLSRTQERLRRFALLSSTERVVNFLISHVQRSGKRVGLEWVVKPALTHQKMGLIAGTGRQTVTTVLNKLRRAGIVHFNRNYLIVRDLEALKKMSAFE